MKKIFFLTDLDYTIYDDKVYLELFGRFDNKRVVLLYDKFLPYFYVEFDSDVNKEDLIIKKDKHSVVRVEIVKKFLLSEEKKLYKIYVNTPKAVKPIKELIKTNFVNFVHSYEANVPYIKRFLFDNDFSTFSFYEVNLVENSSLGFFRNYRVDVFLIDSLELKETNVKSMPKILALDIETYSCEKKIDVENNPILFISLFGDDFKKVLTYKDTESFPDFVEVLKSEKEMLMKFNYYIKEYDPDIITGFFSDGFDLPYISKRAKILGVDFDFSLDKRGITITGSTFKHAKIKGIVHTDIYKFVRSILRASLNTETFSLNEVSRELLGEEKVDVNLDELPSSWENNQNLESFAIYNLKDSELCFHLQKKLFFIMDELAKLTSLPLFYACRANYSTLVESYLFKREKEFNLVSPNKPDENEIKKRYNQTYEGAFVYQPNPGFYKDVVVFDFKSLYPTIIVSHNISPETCNVECDKKIFAPNNTDWFCQDRKGFIPYVLEELINRRSKVKQLMKKANRKDKDILYAQQYALKTVANSIYGYLGYPLSNWYCYECARSITAFGRMYIKKVIKTFSDNGYEVLYSDTDSIFVTLNKHSLDDVLKLVEKINEELPGIMHLDFQGFYKAAIFVSTKDLSSGAKKKYALLDENNNLIIKGFETIRRDWSGIVKEVQEKLLFMILNGSSKDKIVSYLRGVIQSIKSHKIPLEKFVIKTQIRKSIDNYESKGPHVVAAERLVRKGVNISPGMIVSYIISKYGSKLADKVRLPEECNSNDYDPDYYINNQIIPAVKTILSVIGISVEDILAKSRQSSLTGFFK